MAHIIGSAQTDHQRSAFAFKREMEKAILNSGIPKKVIAIDLGVTQSALSHWLSEETGFTMPGHLIPVFCQLVGDDSLIWHLQSAHEKAPDGSGALTTFRHERTNHEQSKP